MLPLPTHLHAAPREISFDSPPQSRTDQTDYQASKPPPKEIILKEKEGRTAKIITDNKGLFHFPTKAGMTHQIQP